MAPMVNNPDSDAFLTEELLGSMDFSINFNEIALLSEMDFDSTKIIEDNGLGFEMQPAPPCALAVQPTEPDHSIYNNYNDLQDLQPVSPEMFLIPASPGLQPASLGLQPACNGSILRPASPGLLQAASPGPYLQAASPGPYLQAASPGPYLQAASPGLLQPPSPASIVRPASPGLLQAASSGSYLQPASPGSILQPAELSFIESSSSFSSEPDYLKPESTQYTIVTCPQPVSEEAAVPVLASYTLQIKEEAAPTQSITEGPKKRGRKPKYLKGTAPPRRSRPRKTKVYEMGPLPDEKLEKKRKNAVNAKLHREKQKNERDTLLTQLNAVIVERDGLLKLVQELRQNEANLRLMLSKGM